MDTLGYDLMRMCRHNRDGSFATQADRRHILSGMAEDLKLAGFKLPSARSLKPKHIQTLLDAWRVKGLSDATIKNRMAYLRWWAEIVGKASIIPRRNEELGIEKRKRAKIDKGQELDMTKVAEIECPYVRISVQLMAAFGLRQKEALLLKPSEARRGRLLLVAKGTKGGRPRRVPIRTQEQRMLLAEADALARGGSLVPTESYIEQKKRFEYRTMKVGLRNLHGLRHAYAQRRYLELTGWDCPAVGGRSRAELSPSERRRDEEVRGIISEELGHGRIDVLAAYLG